MRANEPAPPVGERHPKAPLDDDPATAPWAMAAEERARLAPGPRPVTDPISARQNAGPDGDRARSQPLAADVTLFHRPLSRRANATHPLLRFASAWAMLVRGTTLMAWHVSRSTLERWAASPASGDFESPLRPSSAWSPKG